MHQYRQKQFPVIISVEPLLGKRPVIIDGVQASGMLAHYWLNAGSRLPV